MGLPSVSQCRTKEEMHQCYGVIPAEPVHVVTVHIAVDRKDVTRRHFFTAGLVKTTHSAALSLIGKIKKHFGTCPQPPLLS